MPNWWVKLVAVVIGWSVKIGSGEFFCPHTRVLAVLIIIVSFPALTGAQNCDVDFPGISQLNYSSACGAGSLNSLTLGKSTEIATGDQFTFDAPATINIQGNLDIKAAGNGRVVIPSGVTVIVGGNMTLDPSNGQCQGGSPCIFTMVVNGHLQVAGNLKNNLESLVWEGLGTVEAKGGLENSSNGCMSCGLTCPDFPITSGGCVDDGSRCLLNFCSFNYGNACLLDFTKPKIDNCPADIQLSASANCTAIATWVPPVAFDNCKVSSFKSTHQPGESFPLGLTTVSYTAIDSSGNTITCSFEIEVVDDTAPEFLNCPSDMVIAGMDPGDDHATVFWTEPDVIDNCKLVQVTSSHQPGSKFPVGLTVVSYDAIDEAGNSQKCTFSIQVLSNSPPEAPNVMLKAKSGEPTNICLQSSDQDGDQISLTKIEYKTSSGAVDKVDTLKNCFVFTSTDGIEGPVTISATICDDKDPAACSNVAIEIEVSLELVTIYKAFSPNGDGINDLWLIGNIEQYADNSVIIFDRWGSVIYEASGYNNQDIVWNGMGNKNRMSSREVVPAGTYYFNITIPGVGSEKGFVELLD